MRRRAPLPSNSAVSPLIYFPHSLLNNSASSTPLHLPLPAWWWRKGVRETRASNARPSPPPLPQVAVINPPRHFHVYCCSRKDGGVSLTPLRPTSTAVRVKMVALYRSHANNHGTLTGVCIRSFKCQKMKKAESAERPETLLHVATSFGLSATVRPNPYSR